MPFFDHLRVASFAQDTTLFFRRSGFLFSWIWATARWAGCILFTLFISIDAYAWIGPGISERILSAAVCGLVAGMLWTLAAHIFEQLMSI